MKTWYRFALFCGLEPLLLGVVIFVTWLVTRARWLEFAGLINMMIGSCLVWVGLICLGVYAHKSRQQQLRGYVRRCLLALGIMLVNYPVAITFILIAEHLISESTAQVENRSGLLVEDFRLTEREKEYQMGDIEPGTRIERKFHFRHEGAVNYSFVLDHTPHSGIMFGYVTSGIGVTAVMIIDESGRVEVKEHL